MTFNAMTEHYEEITVCGKPALFTSIRIKRDTIQMVCTLTMSGTMMSAGTSLVRSRLCDGQPLGTIILAEPLELPDDGRRYIDEDTDWNYAPLDGEAPPITNRVLPFLIL